MIDEKSWEEFRNSGMLWFINVILHTFGWAIVYDTSDDKIVRVFPARVRFRGFSERTNTEGYIKLSKYMADNAKDLLEEAQED